MWYWVINSCICVSSPPEGPIKEIRKSCPTRSSADIASTRVLAFSRIVFFPEGSAAFEVIVAGSEKDDNKKMNVSMVLQNFIIVFGDKNEIFTFPG